jgi:hypothetical protein
MVDVCRYLVPKLCNVVGYGIFLTINVIITIVYGIQIVDYGLPQLLMHMFIHFFVSAQCLMVSTKFINFNRNVVWLQNLVSLSLLFYGAWRYKLNYPSSSKIVCTCNFLVMVEMLWEVLISYYKRKYHDSILHLLTWIDNDYAINYKFGGFDYLLIIYNNSFRSSIRS